MKRANVYKVWYHVVTVTKDNQEKSSGQKMEIVAAAGVNEAFAAIPAAPEGSENRFIMTHLLHQNVIVP